MIDFRSDNTCGIHPLVMDAIIKTNQATAASYGADDDSLLLTKKFSELFETEVTVWLTNTGTAANSLALSALSQPFQAIFCAETSHIHTDECTAPEFFTGGAKLFSVPEHNGKIDLTHLPFLLDHAKSMQPHAAIPNAISLTQSTESGTVYTLSELQKIKAFAKENDLLIHMDGARLANALATLDCSPADLTWRQGVDVLTLGGTKNGAMMAEAVIFFNQTIAKNFAFRHKRAGQLMSKMRFVACQWLALLDNQLWLSNAKHANLMAKKLADIFAQHQIYPHWPVEANAVFVELPQKIFEAFVAADIKFYEWHSSTKQLYRFVTSCFTTEADLKAVFRCLELL